MPSTADPTTMTTQDIFAADYYAAISTPLPLDNEDEKDLDNDSNGVLDIPFQRRFNTRELILCAAVLVLLFLVPSPLPTFTAPTTTVHCESPTALASLSTAKNELSTFVMEHHYGGPQLCVPNIMQEFQWGYVYTNAGAGILINLIDDKPDYNITPFGYLASNNTTTTTITTASPALFIPPCPPLQLRLFQNVHIQILWPAQLSEQPTLSDLHSSLQAQQEMFTRLLVLTANVLATSLEAEGLVEAGARIRPRVAELARSTASKSTTTYASSVDVLSVKKVEVEWRAIWGVLTEEVCLAKREMQEIEMTLREALVVMRRGQGVLAWLRKVHGVDM
ncbi:hypothetical protein CLAFUW4_14823 [Fulvia fulva]|nr:hypothetical protein CLAFUR0_14816 [Fulvia fulva]WPV22994.1 hypothetical protein CLAFUW4_14823 [Fulvia fulva]WPV37949.1 hypothetical protein CLAFUW7_14824 [Fulvia fulva]